MLFKTIATAAASQLKFLRRAPRSKYPMRLGIFGDSYGDTAVDPERSWPSLIGGDIAVANYSQSGTGLYHAWQQFHRYQQGLDRIIVLVTAWSRLYTQLGWITGLRHCEDLCDRDPARRDLYQALIAYQRHLQVDQQLRDTQQLMLRDMETTRPDLLLINCFDPGVTARAAEFDLYSVSDIDHQHYGLDPATVRDLRCCHINDENNQRMAELVTDWVQGHSVRWHRDQFQHSAKPRSHYFR